MKVFPILLKHCAVSAIVNIASGDEESITYQWWCDNYIWKITL